jgi:hypothetical protein
MTAQDTANYGKGTSGTMKVFIEFDIKGTRSKPQLLTSIKVQTDPTRDPQDYTAGGKSGGDVQSDAFSFLLTGHFADERTAQDNATIVDASNAAGATLVNNFTSNMVSGVFQNFLQQQFPFITGASLSYQGTSSDLRINAELGKGYIEFGGQVLNNIGNANVTYQLSLGDVFNTQRLRNLMFELQRVTDDYVEENRKPVTNSARVFYRFTF